MTDFLYHYPDLRSGILIKRYKRFLADIELSTGEFITAHCPNTGPMTGVCTPGQPVQVSYNPNPKRKLAYTWEMIQLQDTVPTWVGINTALPNRIVQLALTQRILPNLGNYDTIKPEVIYGVDRKSRVDFYLSQSLETLPALNLVASGLNSSPASNNTVVVAADVVEKIKVPSIYLEVKNTTWCQETLALFPDTVTERGQKHLRELMQVVHQGDRGVILFFINRSDCTDFAPGDSADPTYGKLLRDAIACGVEVLPCRFETTPIGVRYLGLANLKL